LLEQETTEQEITTTTDVQTHLEALLNVSLGSACFIDEASFRQKAKFQSSDYSHQVPDYQHFLIITYLIKGILLCMQKKVSGYVTTN
jgi:hypothetical protein